MIRNLIAISFYIFFTGTVYSQSNSNIKRDVVRMGSLSSFIDGVDIKDAEAAFGLLTNSFVKRMKAKKIYDFDFEGKMYENVNLLKKDIENRSLNYYNVPTSVYFDINEKNEFTPFLTGSNHLSNKFTYYLLITNVKNPTNDLSNIVNQNISIPQSIENSIGTIWLKNTLREQLGAKSYKTVSLITKNQNESEDLLSVFFGKTNYSLISEGAFELACELNPSLKRKIKIIKKSTGLINGVFVHRIGINQTTIKVIEDIAVDIHNDIEGKQILNLFKIQNILRISKDDLSESENVINKYKTYFNK